MTGKMRLCPMDPRKRSMGTEVIKAGQRRGIPSKRGMKSKVQVRFTEKLIFQETSGVGQGVGCSPTL